MFGWLKKIFGKSSNKIEQDFDDVAVREVKQKPINHKQDKLEKHLWKKVSNALSPDPKVNSADELKMQKYGIQERRKEHEEKVRRRQKKEEERHLKNQGKNFIHPPTLDEYQLRQITLKEERKQAAISKIKNEKAYIKKMKADYGNDYEVPKAKDVVKVEEDFLSPASLISTATKVVSVVKLASKKNQKIAPLDLDISDSWTSSTASVSTDSSRSSNGSRF